ncbi:MAG: hypothetical protein ACM3JI_00585 [Anaerolineae bacterium]
MRKKYYFGIAGCSIIVAFFILWHGFTISPSFTQIPVTFTSFDTPLLASEIEETKYLLKFDLGSKFQLSLNKDILASITDKKPYCVAKWRDIKGNFYESPSYLVPKIRVGDLILTEVIVKQEDDIYVTHTTLWKDSKDERKFENKDAGTLGRPLLEKTNLLLDFSNSKIIACNTKQKLKEMGFLLDEMAQVPIETDAKGIIVKVNTDAGTLKLVLDTGATITLIRSSLLQAQACKRDERGFLTFVTSRFVMGKKDFGRKNLFLYDITPELHEIDGILGMDFLKNHVIYIDYPNKVIYVGDRQPSSFSP